MPPTTTGVRRLFGHRLDGMRRLAFVFCLRVGRDSFQYALAIADIGYTLFGLGRGRCGWPNRFDGSCLLAEGRVTRQCRLTTPGRLFGRLRRRDRKLAPRRFSGVARDLGRGRCGWPNRFDGSRLLAEGRVIRQFRLTTPGRLFGRLLRRRARKLAPRRFSGVARERRQACCFNGHDVDFRRHILRSLHRRRLGLLKLVNRQDLDCVGGRPCSLEFGLAARLSPRAASSAAASAPAAPRQTRVARTTAMTGSTR